jgi:hypothetical protein
VVGADLVLLVLQLLGSERDFRVLSKFAAARELVPPVCVTHILGGGYPFHGFRFLIGEALFNVPSGGEVEDARFGVFLGYDVGLESEGGGTFDSSNSLDRQVMLLENTFGHSKSIFLHKHPVVSATTSQGRSSMRHNVGSDLDHVAVMVFEGTVFRGCRYH